MRTNFRCWEFTQENGRWTERVLPPAILAISKNGRTVLKTSNDAKLKICNWVDETGAWKERCELNLTLDENHNVLFNTDGTALVVAQKVEESSSVSVFASGPEDGWARTGDSFICDCEISCIAISNDGQRLAIVTGEKQLKFFAIKEDKDKKYKWMPRFAKDDLRTAGSTRKVIFVGKKKWDVVAISHVEGKHVRYGRRQHVAGWHNEECIGELSGGGNHVFDIQEGKLRGYLRKQLSHVVRTSRCTLRGALLKEKRKKSNLLSLFEDLSKSFTDAYDQAVFYLNSALAVSEDKSLRHFYGKSEGNAWRNLISKMVAGKTHVVFEELGLPSELEVGCSIGARPDFLPGAIISYMATNLETNVKVTLERNTKHAFKKVNKLVKRMCKERLTENVLKGVAGAQAKGRNQLLSRLPAVTLKVGERQLRSKTSSDEAIKSRLLECKAEFLRKLFWQFAPLGARLKRMAATAKVAGLAEMSLDTSDNGSDDDEEDEGDYEEDEGDLMDDFVEVEVEDVIEVSKTVNYEQLYLLLKEMNAILACHEERTYKLVPQAQPTSFTRHFRFDAFFIASLLIHCRCYNPSMVASEFLRKDAGRKRRPQKSMSSRPVKRDRMDENLHAHAHPVLDPQVLSSAGFNENTYKTISEKCKSRMKNDDNPTAADLVRHCKRDLLGLVFDVKKMQKALPRNVNFPSSISTNGHALRIYYHEYEVLKVTKEQQEEKKKVFAKYKLKLRTLANARGKKFKLDLKRLKKARKKMEHRTIAKSKSRRRRRTRRWKRRWTRLTKR